MQAVHRQASMELLHLVVTHLPVMCHRQLVTTHHREEQREDLHLLHPVMVHRGDMEARRLQVGMVHQLLVRMVRLLQVATPVDTVHPLHNPLQGLALICGSGFRLVFLQNTCCPKCINFRYKVHGKLECIHFFFFLFFVFFKKNFGGHKSFLWDH